MWPCLFCVHAGLTYRCMKTSLPSWVWSMTHWLGISTSAVIVFKFMLVWDHSTSIKTIRWGHLILSWHAMICCLFPKMVVPSSMLLIVPHLLSSSLTDHPVHPVSFHNASAWWVEWIAHSGSHRTVMTLMTSYWYYIADMGTLAFNMT